MKALQLVPTSMVRKRPIIQNDRVIWPWVITATDRANVENASRPEILITPEHMDAILDARNLRQTVNRAQTTG